MSAKGVRDESDTNQSSIGETFSDEKNFDEVGYNIKDNLEESEKFEKCTIENNDQFFEIIFLEETWIEVFNNNKYP